jgi:hypothetical protein
MYVYYIVFFFNSSDYGLHCNFRFHVAKEGPVTVVVTVNIWAGDLLLDLVAALTVGLMGIGLVTAKLVTGKIGAIVVEIVAI